MNKVIFITGASSGIGKACAQRFAEDGCSLIISGRRTEKLEALAFGLKEKYNIPVFVLPLDVTKRTEVQRAIATLPPALSQPDVLINNAGLALGLSPIHEGNIDHWETMIDTNVKGLLYVSRALLPAMIKHGSGHIINIGSIAGREVYPNGNVYCATKAAVDSLTKSLRMELLAHGIKVTQIAPGAVETEFSNVRFEGDVEKAKAVYKGYDPLHDSDVAHVVHFAATLPPHVNINDLLLMPYAQAAAGMILRS